MYNPTFRLPAALSAALAVAIVCMGTVFAQDRDNGEDRDMKLLKASERGRVDEVRLMLDLGASVVCSDEDYGGTPLHWAAYKGHVESVYVLLNRGAEINAKNKDERTALILAAAMNQTPVVKLLLERGADAGITGKDGRSALDWAARKRRAQVVRILKTPVAKQEEIAPPPSLTATRVTQPETGPRTAGRVDAGDAGEMLNRALIRAAQRGDARRLVRLLDQGADPNAADARSGRTALVWACSKGREDAVKALLDKGADANVLDPTRGVSPLMEASERGFLSIVRLLIEKGAEINTCDSSGRNALMLACRKGNPKVVVTLIEAKADVNATDASGRTVQQWAALSGRRDVKELVLGQSVGVSENGKREKAGGETAGSLRREEAKSVSGPPGEAPVPSDGKDLALLDAAAKGELNQVQKLVAAGADLKVTDQVGATPLVAASAAGRNEVVRFLLEQGSDPNVKTTDRMVLQTTVPAGMTSLILAAFTGNLELAELLLEKGADINAKNDAGVSALMTAVESDQREIADLLLRKGVDVNAKSNSGVTALDVAKRMGATEMGELLEKHGATASQPVVMGESKDVQTGTSTDGQPRSVAPSERVTDAGATPDGTNKALTEAVTKGNMEELVRFLDQGADVNARGSDGTTLLMMASGSGNLVAVTLLADRGAELNAKDPNGKTALTYSVEAGHRDVTKFLRTRGATGADMPQLASRKPPTDTPAGKHRMGSLSPNSK